MVESHHAGARSALSLPSKLPYLSDKTMKACIWLEGGRIVSRSRNEPVTQISLSLSCSRALRP